MIITLVLYYTRFIQIHLNFAHYSTQRWSCHENTKHDHHSKYHIVLYHAIGSCKCIWIWLCDNNPSTVLYKVHTNSFEYRALQYPTKVMSGKYETWSSFEIPQYYVKLHAFEFRALQYPQRSSYHTNTKHSNHSRSHSTAASFMHMYLNLAK